MAIKTRHTGEALDRVEITPCGPTSPLDIRKIEVETTANEGKVSVWVYLRTGPDAERIPEHAWFDGDDLIAFGAACIELGLNARLKPAQP